jgi:hypothetical protein
MKLPRHPREKQSSATIVPTLALMLAFTGLVVLTVQASQPSWWNASGAVLDIPQVTTNDGIVTTNNYYVINQGQLKQFTLSAVNELNTDLADSGGAGPDLSNLVYGWELDYATNGYSSSSPKPTDYQAMNLGQLKYVGNKVWSRLVAAGYTNAVPAWLAQNTNSDWQLANIGQLKTVFNFDLSLAGPTSVSATTNSGGTVDLTWTLPATNNATSLVIEEQNSDSTWSVVTTLTNATLTSYSVTGVASGQNPSFQIVAKNSTSSSVPASSDADLVLPSNVNAVHGATDGEVDVSWANNSTNAIHNLVEQSADGTNWSVIARLSPTATSYAVTNLTIGQSYYFGVSVSNH